MKCSRCEALLWNTPPGKCPNCQTKFGVRDYRFIWYSVKFHCPKCNDVVLARELDEKGHPTVLHMNCMGCGSIVHFDNVLIEPKDGTQPMVPEAPAHWWEDRDSPALRVLAGIGLIGSKGPRSVSITKVISMLFGFFVFVIFFLICSNCVGLFTRNH